MIFSQTIPNVTCFTERYRALPVKCSIKIVANGLTFLAFLLSYLKIFSSFKSYVRRKWSYSCTTEKLSFRQNGVLHKKRHSVSPPKRAWRSAMSFGSNRNVQYKIVLYSTSAFRHPCDSTCLTVKETYRLCLSNNILAPS